MKTKCWELAGVFTMLHRLCGSGHVEFVRPLLHKLREAQMSILPGDASLLTLLRCAAGRNRKDVISFFFYRSWYGYACKTQPRWCASSSCCSRRRHRRHAFTGTNWGRCQCWKPVSARLPLLRQVSQIDKMLCKFSRVLILYTKLYVLWKCAWSISEPVAMSDYVLLYRSLNTRLL